VAATPPPVHLGLISDTHMPDRCLALPEAVFAALAGVDLILHAGDVGALWVLDRLSAIAPVVAVHGNDDSGEAQRELPMQHLLAVGGRRLLLLHGHLPDPEAEMAARRDDAWEPKLARRIEIGRRAGAAIVVFGHTHIPMAHEADGVLLINPGAIASGNAITRQRLQTVARLTLRDDAPPRVEHRDLAAPTRPYRPIIAWPAGYRAALEEVTESIATPALLADWSRLRAEVAPLARAAWLAVVRRAAFRCWNGQQATFGHEDLLAELAAEPALSPAERAHLADLVLAGAPPTPPRPA
jgi:uncharacterized protein